MDERLRVRAVTMGLGVESPFEPGDPVVIDMNLSPAIGWDYIHGHKGIFKEYGGIDNSYAIVECRPGFSDLLRANGNAICIHPDGIHIMTKVLRFDFEEVK